MKRAQTAGAILLLLLLAGNCFPIAAAAAPTYERAELHQLDREFRNSGGVIKPRSAQNQRQMLRSVQRMLNELGFGPVRVDGEFTSSTKRTVVKFQKSKGLVQDGCVNKSTWNRLLSEYRRLGNIR